LASSHLTLPVPPPSSKAPGWSRFVMIHHDFSDLCLHRFFLASHDPARGEREQREVLGALLNTPEAEAKIGQFFYTKTRELITAASFTLVGGKSRCVDVVQYVLRQVPIYWVATEIVRTLWQTHLFLSLIFHSLVRLAFH
jgi:hypothetical protein